ncbi:MAG: hypothetical protein EAZ91_07475 [Cytophagales bacterium]|nr:MAG: hypothetical protein EAZ91_07475 [Cytophagales bacterium]
MYKTANPYRTEGRGQTVVVLNLTEYWLTILMTLSPVALRTLLILCAKLTPDGSAMATLVEIRKYNARSICNISLGLKELLDRDLIRRKALSSYWISNQIAYNLNLLPGNA